MKLSVKLLLISLVSTIKGDELADQWKEGALEIGPIQLEPGLNGTELFTSLFDVIGKYVNDLEGAFYEQLNYYFETFAGGAGVRGYMLKEALSAPDDTLPPDAFDQIITNHTFFLVDFLYTMKEYASEIKPQMPNYLPKLKAKRSLRQPIRPNTAMHGLNDLLSHFDLMWVSDLSMLSSYIDEMIYLGRERILQNCQDVMARMKDSIKLSIYGNIKTYVQTSDASIEKIQRHTSNLILQNYIQAKFDAMKLITILENN